MHEHRGAVERDGQVGVREGSEAAHARRVDARLVRHLRELDVAPRRGADDEERQVAGLQAHERLHERLDALARLEAADGEQVLGGQVELGGAGVGILRQDDARAHGPADHPHPVAQVDVARELLGQRVRRDHDGVGVLPRALGHGLRPGDGCARHALRVRPRVDVVDGGDDLVVRVDAVVAAQRSEEAGRVDHAGSAGRREAQLPGAGQLAAGERDARDAGEAGQAPLEVGRLLGRDRGDDALDLAAARRRRDDRARQVLGVAADAAGRGAGQLVDDHAQRGGHGPPSRGCRVGPREDHRTGGRLGDPGGAPGGVSSGASARRRPWTGRRTRPSRTG